MRALDKDSFQKEVLDTQGLVLVDYWSETCVPCKALMPEMEALETTYGDRISFTKLNIAGARRLAISQKVLGLPTIVLYRDGEKVAELTGGNVTRETVEAMIQEHL